VVRYSRVARSRSNLYDTQSVKDYQIGRVSGPQPGLWLVEGPASDGFGEIVGVFILAKGGVRLDAIYVTA
jgi:hypothetical protein